MNASKYRNDVVWRTKVENVRYLTEETEETPATYRLTIKPEDLNDNGSMDINIETKQCLVDHYGTPYSIIAVNGLILDVSDDFRTKECPQSGLTGFIYKTAYKGRSYFLPPVMYRFLHPNAAANRDQYNLAILWGNDSNGLRIPFVASDAPSIENYQTDQVINGATYNLQEDYGDNPGCDLYQEKTDEETGDILELKRSELDARVMVDGKIDRIHFGTLGDVINGFILIYRK